jgi:Restriction endonuclease BpuJI - N terminal/Domain of unknown function (DUF3883)
MYEVPQKHFFRLHHVRPRFKSDLESVLLFFCENVCLIGPSKNADFAKKLVQLIRQYPGNATKSQKTIQNWRTEISAIFGLVTRNGLYREAGTYAHRLATSQDLVEFFRYFLLTFQYPGGHLKPASVQEQILNGVRFHPARFIIDMLHEGERLVGDKSFSISAAELTHCAFNDLRVTATHELNAKDVAELILINRARHLSYDETGDVTRYAKDILDYLNYANLLVFSDLTKRYALDPITAAARIDLREKAVDFNGYAHLYSKKSVSLQEIAEIEEEWFDFVNEDRTSSPFAENLRDVLAEALAGDSTEASTLASNGNLNFTEEVQALIDGFERALSGDAGAIGRAGESLTISHEKHRLANLGRADLVDGVKKIPDQFGVGYDIKSYEGNAKLGEIDSDRYIEVKTTRSHQMLRVFKLTGREFGSAKTLKDAYYIYRIMIVRDGVRLFVIRNPFQLWADDALSGTVKKDGVEFSFDENAGHWEELPILRNAWTSGQH